MCFLNYSEAKLGSSFQIISNYLNLVAYVWETYLPRTDKGLNTEAEEAFFFFPGEFEH